jgi:hypothetical protein
MTATAEINRELAARVLGIVDAGLSKGLGKRKPGEMCVEACVCYALGLPHGDDPKCVSPALRQLKIALNDKAWSSNAARAKGMRRLAIIQLGTAGELDDKAFAAAVAEMTIRTFVPIALRAAASIAHIAAHKDSLECAASRCENEGTRGAAANAANAANAADAAYAANAANAAYAANAANAADAAAYAANAAAAAANAAVAAAKRDSILSQFAEAVVQILIRLGVRSASFLDLAPLDPS